MLSVVDALEIIDEAESLAADRQFGELLELLCDVPGVFVESDPTLGYLLAFGYYMSGKEIVAHGLLVRLHEQFVGDKAGRLYRRIANLRGIVEVELGNLLEAEHLLSEVQSSAEVASDQRYIAYATLNRGIISEIQGFSDTAIAAFERARLAFQKLGDTAAVAGCAHNIGMAYRRLGDYSAAERQFAIALGYFEKNGSVEEMLASSLERALALAMRGELQLANYTARVALEQSEAIGNQRLCGEAYRVIGSTALRQGDLGIARGMLTQSLGVARSGQLRLLQAEVLMELALAENIDGRAEAANDMLYRAAEILAAMGARQRASQLISPEVGPDNAFLSSSSDG